MSVLGAVAFALVVVAAMGAWTWLICLIDEAAKR